MTPSAPTIRVGIPHTGGGLLAAAGGRGYPVLLSANAFAKVYPPGHERAGWFRGFRQMPAGHLAGHDAALDSAGFVAMSLYRGFRWTVADYYDLVQQHRWSWHAAMDYCCEPEIADDPLIRLLRIAGTAALLAQCSQEARRRGLPLPIPVLQGWTPAEYALCADWLPVLEWPALVGVGSVCRRPLGGPAGLVAIIDALDAILPPHVRFHAFGVKGSALGALARHPRLASVDSMAWDMAARSAHRTGRTMARRIAHMEGWVDQQQARVEGGGFLQIPLFIDGQASGPTPDRAELKERLAMDYCDLILSGDMDFEDAQAAFIRESPFVTAESVVGEDNDD